MKTEIKNSEINVEKRAVYEFGKRRRFVWDARGTLRGIEYRATAATKPEAIAQAKAEIVFLLSAGSFEAGGCAVRPSGFQAWDFLLAGTRCVMCFGAPDLSAAIARAASDYADHPDAAEFCRAAAAR
jgi:hypothetical protein